jgi:hypothetical protein
MPYMHAMACRYHKLQSAALDRQLPPELRTVDVKGLPPPAQLSWQPSSNLLHPLQLLSRELTGCAAVCTPRQPLKGPVAQLEQVAFGESCALLLQPAHVLLSLLC